MNNDHLVPAAVDPDAEARVQAVTATGLDAVAEPMFDNIAGLVRTLLDVPVAVVSLLDARRQFFPGASGLAQPWVTRRQTPLSHALCQLVALAQEPLVVTDARHDRRCDTNPAISDLGIVGYAGMPLTDAAGTVMGALCAIDHEPRIWTEAELSLLADMALACSDSLRLRIASHHAEAGRIAAADASRLALAASARSQLLLKASVLLSQARTVAQIVAAVSTLTSPVFDPAHVGMVLLDAEQRLQVFGADRLPGDVADRWASFPASAPLPAAEAFRNGQLVALADPAAITAGYPQLAADFTALGWQALACGPVPGVRGTLGVLTFAWNHPQELDADQRSVIITVAGYVGQALQRVTYLDEQNTAARTLQQALLTRLPPTTNGHRLAARYLPAHHGDLIGGDWYDAVPLADSRLALIIGDVSGHNLTAAAAMSELRSMLRGLLIDRAETPSAVLQRLDHANHALRANTIATVLIAYLDTEPDGSHTLQWSNAGHTPPTVITTDGQITTLPGSDPLLGARHRKPRTTHQHRLPPGAILLLHTDGLVETRNATIDEGIARLHRLLADHPHLDPDSLADRLVAHADSGTREDDVALLLAATAPVTADRPATTQPRAPHATANPAQQYEHRFPQPRRREPERSPDQGRQPVSTSPPSPQDASRRLLGPLATRIVALAGTPDDVSGIDTRLAAIAQAAVDTLTPVSYASITAVRDGNNTTVATTSELATAADRAQYADDSGPCLDALHHGTSFGVDDMTTTISWPGFRAAATRMGLHASLSIPLFAGSGAPIAALNLYSRNPLAMAPLSAQVWTVYNTEPQPHPQPDDLLAATGGADLVAGLIEAFEVRAVIQRAIGVVMADEHCSAQDAYLTLRLRAAEAGTGLTGVATDLHQHLPHPGREPHP